MNDLGIDERVPVTPVNQHIGRRIRGKRRALGLTEDDLAKALGIDRSQIEAYERGTTCVTPKHLMELSEFLDVPVSYFVPSAPHSGR